MFFSLKNFLNKFILITLAIIFLFQLTGCGYSLEEVINMQNYENQGRKNAIAHIKAKYGFDPTITEVSCSYSNPVQGNLFYSYDLSPAPTGNVFVTYEDTEGNILLEDEITGKVDEPFNIEEKEIPFYRVIERPESTEGILIDDTIELKYILEKIKGIINVNFIDRQGNTIYESISTEGYLNEEFYLKANNKDGYQIVENEEIRVNFVEGETTIDVIYEKMQEPPRTGDIDVILLTLILTISIVGVIYIVSKKIIKKQYR